MTIPAPQVGGSYTEGLLKEPRAVNPIYSLTSDTDRDITRLVFSRLLTYDGEGNPEPDLAEKFEVSEDGKIYTLYLRSNALWHDGRPVTAEDVIFTIKVIQNPQYKSPLRPNWQGVEVEKLDERTLRFVLKTSYAPFIENLAVGILPQHLWSAVNPEQALLHKLNLQPIGSGPYRFSRIRQNGDGAITSYELVRNSNYYRAGPYIKKIAFRFFKTEDELISAWKRGRIDGFGPVPAGRLQEFEGARAAIYSLATPRIFGLFFNSSKAPPFAEKEVRQAFSAALDKKKIAELVSSSGAVRTDAAFLMTPSGITDKQSFDLGKSRELLDKAGWKDSDQDGIRDKTIREGNKRVTRQLNFTLYTSDWPDLVKIAEYMRASFRELGASLAIVAQPFATLETEVIRPRNFDMLLFGQAYGYEIDPFPFWHSSQIKDPGLNVALYNNKKVDKLLEEARRSSDPETRREKYLEAQRIISDDLPAAILYYQLYNYLLPVRIKGVELSQIALPADRFNEIHEWHQKTKRVFK